MQLMKEAALPEEQADALLQDYNSSKLKLYAGDLALFSLTACWPTTHTSFTRSPPTS